MLIFHESWKNYPHDAFPAIEIFLCPHSCTEYYFLSPTFFFCFHIKITVSQEAQDSKSSSPWGPKYTIQEKVAYPVTATESTEYPIAPFTELV